MIDKAIELFAGELRQSITILIDKDGTQRLYLNNYDSTKLKEAIAKDKMEAVEKAFKSGSKDVFSVYSIGFLSEYYLDECWQQYKQSNEI